MDGIVNMRISGYTRDIPGNNIKLIIINYISIDENEYFLHKMYFSFHINSDRLNSKSSTNDHPIVSSVFQSSDYVKSLRIIQ